MPYILHIDTSSDKGLVALALDGNLISQQETLAARDHASSINTMIDKVIGEAGVTLKEIDALAVIGGPGSYTGLRIGLASAKAICYVLDKPLILTNKLSLLALQAHRSGKDEYEYFGSVLPARQNEYFFALYKNQGECLTEPAHLLERDLQVALENLPGKTLLTGTIDPEALRNIGSQHLSYVEHDSIHLVYWCLNAHEEFHCHNFVNLASAEPFYLKQVYTHKH